ncbi:SDR family NAD(P)-dependent oxidoreductase [Pedobacter sp. L105]|uniref:SDR family NAD(P)-dependent oxidoreductase n=1 Tax=Pedobacter sp. L105 TaxID=1641871 RepID=UPI00131AF22D|nr:glucose 1-dehydrogenase [Pedobacter sp. L105]
MSSLDNKVAIVTGASSGIGEAIAITFAREGAKVVVSDINEEGGNKVVELIKSEGGDAFFIKADTSKPEENEKLVAETVKHFGKLDIAVNNAGIGGPAAQTGEYPTESWDKVIAVNLSGVFYGLRYQIPAILASGGGNIINMASVLGQVGTKLSPAYVAAKHGVVGLTKAAALEYANQGIRINSVGPGYIKTPLLVQHLNDGQMDALIKLHPIGRLGESQEIAELVLWLASDKASFVTGTYYAADGGLLAQ